MICHTAWRRESAKPFFSVFLSVCAPSGHKTTKQQTIIELSCMWLLQNTWRILCQECDACSLITCLIKLWSDPLVASKFPNGPAHHDLFRSLTFSPAPEFEIVFTHFVLVHLYRSLDCQRLCSKIHEDMKFWSSGCIWAGYGKLTKMTSFRQLGSIFLMIWYI